MAKKAKCSPQENKPANSLYSPLQIAELVQETERLLPELRAAITTTDWQRRAEEVHALAFAADPHLKELAAIQQCEDRLRADGLGDDELQAAILKRGYNQSPEDKTVSGACQTIASVLGQIMRRAMVPTDSLPKAAVAIAGAVESLKRFLPAQTAANGEKTGGTKGEPPAAPRPQAETLKGEVKAKGKAGTKEQPWDDDAEGYLFLTEVRKLIDDRLSLPTLSKLLTPDGEVRYMRKGQRCKVYLADFRRYMRSRQSDPEWTAAYLNWLQGQKAGKTRLFWKCGSCGHEYAEEANATDHCPNCKKEASLTPKVPPKARR